MTLIYFKFDFSKALQKGFLGIFVFNHEKAKYSERICGDGQIII
jgi:hypothetical protein